MRRPVWWVRRFKAHKGCILSDMPGEITFKSLPILKYMLLKGWDEQEPCVTLHQRQGIEDPKIKAIKPIALGLSTPFTAATLTLTL